MKKFRFSLEKVRRYKSLLKEQKQAALFKAHQEYMQQQQELYRLEALLEEGKRTLLSGRIRLPLIVHKSAYIESIARLIEAQKEVVVAARQRVLECRLAVTEADKEQQVLEKLKQRQREAHRYEMEIKLQNELDEVATSAFLRRS